MRKSEGLKIPEKEIVKEKFCENFERGRLLVRRSRRCNREDLEQFHFVELSRVYHIRQGKNIPGMTTKFAQSELDSAEQKAGYHRHGDVLPLLVCRSEQSFRKTFCEQKRTRTLFIKNWVRVRTVWWTIQDLNL